VSQVLEFEDGEFYLYSCFDGDCRDFDGQVESLVERWSLPLIYLTICFGDHLCIFETCHVTSG